MKDWAQAIIASCLEVLSRPRNGDSLPPHPSLHHQSAMPDDDIVEGVYYIINKASRTLIDLPVRLFGADFGVRVTLRSVLGNAGKRRPIQESRSWIRIWTALSGGIRPPALADKKRWTKPSLHYPKYWQWEHARVGAKPKQERGAGNVFRSQLPGRTRSHKPRMVLTTRGWRVVYVSYI